MSKIYMPGDPERTDDDYMIERPDKPSIKPNISPYNTTYQYGSMIKKKNAAPQTQYGLKGSPIKRIAKSRSRQLSRDRGYERG